MRLLSLIPVLIIVFTTANEGCNSDKSNLAKRKMKDTVINVSNERDTLVLAGGCFWCLEAVYQRMQGVEKVTSGYSNGNPLFKNPTYKEVCAGNTGYAEVVELVFNKNQTSLPELLEVFWRIHNPTTLNRQGNDEGTQYRSGIYYRNEEQRQLAYKSREAAEEAKLWEGKVVTEILPLENFYVAEDYHQNYYNNNPNQSYCVYVVGEKVEKFKKLFKQKLKKDLE